MTRMEQTIDKGDAHDGLHIRRVPADRRDEALSLLLTGQAEAKQSAASQFQTFADQHKLSLEGLWAAYREGQPIVSCLIVPTAGRTAMAFVSPLTQWPQVQACRQLLHQACQAQDPAQASIIQVLLEPAQQLESQALTEAGFTRLAHLVYMQRTTEADLHPSALDSTFRLIHWSPANRDLFTRAILASYENTLDCPGLLGLRHIDDIVAGHMATGVFKPDLWTAVYAEDEPVGVMLINLLPPRQAAELVYLGICPPWRGKGLARKLMLKGLALAHQHETEHMLLAVDQDNMPALRLYQSLHFVSTARKLALIFALT